MLSNNNPVDFVITWVDGEDEAWLETRAKYVNEDKTSIADDWNKGERRFRDWGTLKYWFRGVETFCPWVRRVYFVTWGHVPEWLNLNAKKLVITKHEDYIPAKYLPTFNSHTIELNMHRIDGLAEQFVYFNDDMYAIAPLRKTHFFKAGLPCDSVAFNALSRNPYNRLMVTANNVAVINKHFQKESVLKEHPLHWFNPKYGKLQLRTLLLLPWPRFTGFYEHHTAYPFLKSTFEHIWDLEFEELDNTCLSKFRAGDNVSPWLMRDWQNATGKFVPISPKFRQSFGGVLTDEVFDCIRKQKKRVICVNDDVESQDAFRINQKKLVDAFESILPNKSSFEK